MRARIVDKNMRGGGVCVCKIKDKVERKKREQ